MIPDKITYKIKKAVLPRSQQLIRKCHLCIHRCSDERSFGVLEQCWDDVKMHLKAETEPVLMRFFTPKGIL